MKMKINKIIKTSDFNEILNVHKFHYFLSSHKSWLTEDLRQNRIKDDKIYLIYDAYPSKYWGILYKQNNEYIIAIFLEEDSITSRLDVIFGEFQNFVKKIGFENTLKYYIL